MTGEKNNEKESSDMHDESICTGVAQHVMQQVAKQQEENNKEEDNK